MNYDRTRVIAEWLVEEFFEPNDSPESRELLRTQIDWAMKDHVVEVVEECAVVAERLGSPEIANDLRWRAKRYEATGRSISDV